MAVPEDPEVEVLDRGVEANPDLGHAQEVVHAVDLEVAVLDLVAALNRDPDQSPGPDHDQVVEGKFLILFLMISKID